MKKRIKNIPLARKLLLFSFLITFIVALMISSLSFYLHSKEIKEQLTDKVLDLSELWSEVISIRSVESVISYQSVERVEYHELQNSISLSQGRSSTFVHAAITLPGLEGKSKVQELVSSEDMTKKKRQPFTAYPLNRFQISAFKSAIESKKVSYTEVYTDDQGTWLTAYTPLISSTNKVIAVFVVDIDASVIKKSQSHTVQKLIMIFFIASIAVYFIMKLVIQSVLEPVDEIIRGLNEVSTGNFNVQLAEGETNLAPLFNQFNYMTKQLSLLFERLAVPSRLDQEKSKQAEKELHKFELAIGQMDTLLQETKLLKELQRAEKMNAIGQLAASVAHEIRNPMTVVKGFLQIFLAKEGLLDEERMYVKLMLEEMNRAEKIINEYLALAKPDLELMEKVDASDLGFKVMDLIQSYAMMSKSIVMDTSVEKDVQIKGNISELKQVLINILKNGIEAMKDGGTLSLRVFKDERWGIFEILDTGIGMSEDELERLGTAFYSLKEKGTGMGLLVCYQIVERMKGTIVVKSKKGMGSVFTIKIPLYEERKEG